jgi:hypothetical protein
MFKSLLDNEQRTVARLDSVPANVHLQWCGRPRSTLGIFAPRKTLGIFEKITCRL